MRIATIIPFLIGPLIGVSQTEKSKNFLRGTTAQTGASSEFVVGVHQVVIHSTIGQSGPVGYASVDGARVFQGFIQPSIIHKILTPETPTILEVSLFPNPFIDQLQLNFDFLPETEVIVSVYDISGTVVWSNTYGASNLISIEPRNLSIGYYFFKIECDKMQRVEKILKYK